MNEKENDKQLEVVWNWFEFHADQRLRAFYYFLIIIGALSLGYIQCIQGCDQLKVLSPFIGLLGLLVSYAFLHLEIRNVELVNIGREALRKFHFLPAEIDGTKEPKENYASQKYNALNEALRPEKLPFWLFFVKESFIRHEFWLRFIYLITSFVSLISLAYAFYLIFSWDLIFWMIVAMVFAFLVFLIIYCLWSPWKRVLFLRKYKENTNAQSNK
jgi:hypothetical protein